MVASDVLDRSKKPPTLGTVILIAGVGWLLLNTGVTGGSYGDTLGGVHP